MNVFAFSCSMPPSTNNLFATVRVGGKERRIPSRDYKAWRAKEANDIRAQWERQGSPSFDRHLSLTVHLGLNYKGDISNRLKALEDVLGEAIPGFPNDRWIDRIEIERVPEVSGARVLISQLAAPEARKMELAA